jgi:hypothetical protein
MSGIARLSDLGRSDGGGFDCSMENTFRDREKQAEY